MNEVLICWRAVGCRSVCCWMACAVSSLVAVGAAHSRSYLNGRQQERPLQCTTRDLLTPLWQHTRQSCEAAAIGETADILWHNQRPVELSNWPQCWPVEASQTSVIERTTVKKTANWSLHQWSSSVVLLVQAITYSSVNDAHANDFSQVIGNSIRDEMTAWRFTGGYTLYNRASRLPAAFHFLVPK